MDKKMHPVLAGIGGFVVGSAVMTCIELLGSKVLFPLPAGVDPMDEATLNAAAQAGLIPTGTLVMVVVAWFVGSFTGVATAIGLAPHARGRLQWTLGVLYFAAGVMNLTGIPSPLWMWVAGLGALAFGAFSGARFAAKRADAGTPPPAAV